GLCPSCSRGRAAGCPRGSRSPACSTVLTPRTHPRSPACSNRTTERCRAATTPAHPPADQACMGTQTEPRHRVRAGLIGLTGIGVATLVLVWVVAVPMDAVCPAIGGSGELPACTAADRVAAGARWSLVIAGCYVLTTAAVLLGRQRSRVLVPVAVVAFAVLCALALGQVVAVTGVVVPG